MFKSNIKTILKFGPRKISKGPSGLAMIYLPKEYSWLQGKKALITVEVLEEEEQ